MSLLKRTLNVYICEKHYIRSWLSIDSNNESGEGNSVPEEKNKIMKEGKKSNQIKVNLGCRTTSNKKSKYRSSIKYGKRTYN